VRILEFGLHAFRPQAQDIPQSNELHTAISLGCGRIRGGLRQMRGSTCLHSPTMQGCLRSPLVLDDPDRLDLEPRAGPKEKFRARSKDFQTTLQSCQHYGLSRWRSKYIYCGEYFPHLHSCVSSPLVFPPADWFHSVMPARRGRPHVPVSPCGFCGKRFKRLEHLQRHERIRTLLPIKPKAIVAGPRSRPD
jgi:hypothetical protein